MFPLIPLAETDSTNRYISQLYRERGATLAEWTTVTAEFQTAGKGQRGNSWEAEAGQNLLFSFLLRPLFLEARRQFVLSQLVCLALKEVLDEETGDISVKWPNDIYWREKKICGILIENDLEGHRIGCCITGIGLNVNQTRFTSDAPNPVSLRQITGREHDRAALLERILTRAQAYYSALQNDEAAATALIRRRYAESLFRREGLHEYEDAEGRFRARLLRVEEDGHFVLEDTEGKVRKYLFKEVQYVL